MSKFVWCHFFLKVPICGQVEDTEHYLLHCPFHDLPRDIVARTIEQKTGLYHLDIQHLNDVYVCICIYMYVYVYVCVYVYIWT